MGFVSGNTETLGVFVNLHVPVLERLSERRKLAKQVSEVDPTGNCTSSSS